MQLLPVLVPRQAPYHLLIDDTRDNRIAPVIASQRLWEPAETALFVDLLHPGLRVVDVGAHVGYFTVMFSRLCGPDGFVHAFEPEPSNHRLLCANLLVNDCSNVAAHALALSDTAGTDELFLSPDNGGDHRLYFGAGRAHCSVRTDALDNLLADDRVDFVKIDAQGAEPRILRGMRRLIGRERAHLGVLMEFAPGLLERYAGGLQSFMELLAALDAHAFWLRMDRNGLRLDRADHLPRFLERLAGELAAKGEEDASGNLLVFFGEQAQRLHLSRLALA